MKILPVLNSFLLAAILAALILILVQLHRPLSVQQPLRVAGVSGDLSYFVDPVRVQIER